MAQQEDADIEESVIDEEAESEDEWNPFDEVREEFQPGPPVRVMHSDGMPTEHAPVQESTIPALSIDSLVCLGDYSEFVRRDAIGDIVRRFNPDEVFRAPNGEWYLKKVKSAAADGTFFAVGSMTADENAVAPVRPQCIHYVAQESELDLNPEHRQFYRLCAARRTTEGAFVSLRDRGVYACTMRDPVDIASEERIRAFDERKMAEGRNRKYLPLFQGQLAEAMKKEAKDV